jgi:hypothetical protein
MENITQTTTCNSCAPSDDNRYIVNPRMRLCGCPHRVDCQYYNLMNNNVIHSPLSNRDVTDLRSEDSDSISSDIVPSSLSDQYNLRYEHSDPHETQNQPYESDSDFEIAWQRERTMLFDRLLDQRDSTYNTDETNIDDLQFVDDHGLYET